MLGVAKKKRARFLLTSTSEVYGDPEVHPQPESYWGHVNPIGPRGVYDEAKRYAEALTMAYHRQQGVDTRIARIFNTYGPRMRPHDGRAIPTFLRQALQDKPLTVFGDGSQTRSFCYVSDLVRGLVGLMASEYHQPVNLGNPIEMTLLELAETVIEVTGSRSEIVFEALPQDDPKVRQPDITLAREVLEWEPEVELRRRASHDDRAVRHRAPDGRATLAAAARQHPPPASISSSRRACRWCRPGSRRSGRLFAPRRGPRSRPGAGSRPSAAGRADREPISSANVLIHSSAVTEPPPRCQCLQKPLPCGFRGRIAAIFASLRAQLSLRVPRAVRSARRDGSFAGSTSREPSFGCPAIGCGRIRRNRDDVASRYPGSFLRVFHQRHARNPARIALETSHDRTRHTHDTPDERRPPAPSWRPALPAPRRPAARGRRRSPPTWSPRACAATCARAARA